MKHYYIILDALSLKPVARVAIKAPGDAETRDIVESLIEQNVIDKSGMFYEPETNDIDSFYYLAVNSYVYDNNIALPILRSVGTAYAVSTLFEPDKPVAYIAMADDADEAVEYVNVAITDKYIPDRFYRITETNLLTIKSKYTEVKRIG